MFKNLLAIPIFVLFSFQNVSSYFLRKTIKRNVSTKEMFVIFNKEITVNKEKDYEKVVITNSDRTIKKLICKKIVWKISLFFHGKQ
jgi:hypothetical protein